MGRELKRVSLDFDWPWEGPNKTWPGYMFGHLDDCPRDDERGDYANCGKSWHDEIPPPVGDGFQLWETTTEGSPVSPVFASLDALCDWAEPNATTLGTTHKATAAEWKRMLSDGLVTTVIAPGLIAL